MLTDALPRRFAPSSGRSGGGKVGWLEPGSELLKEVANAYKVHGSHREAAASLGMGLGTFQRLLNHTKRKKIEPDDQEESLRREVLALRGQIALIKRENETAESIRRKIFDLAERPPDPPAWTLRERGGSGHRGIPITIWSDWHWGESVVAEQVGGVNEFTRKVAERRVKRLVETTRDIADNHMGSAKKPYPGIIICLGGDMMTGDIHDDLRETSWATPQQTINELTDVLAASIDNLATHFGNAFIPCVVGNHGRDTLKPRSSNVVFTSHEWVIYTNLERHFRSTKRVQFLISPDIDAHFRTFGHRFLLTHGDRMGVKGGNALIGVIGPIIRGAIKVGQAERRIGRDFDTLLVCHYHALMEPPHIFGNGSLIGYSHYARNMLRADPERPAQWLFFNHASHGNTARWPIYLEDKLRAEMDKEWVSWPKTVMPLA